MRISASSLHICDGSVYPLKRDPRPGGDGASNTRKSRGFDPAAPTSEGLRLTALPLDALPAPHSLTSSFLHSGDERDALTAHVFPFATDEEDLSGVPSTFDDDEQERGRRLVRPNATSNTYNPSRSRTPSNRTDWKPPKRLLSPDGKGAPCVCEETLASSPATIASPGSPRADFTSPRHSSVLPPSPPSAERLSTQLQQSSSAGSEHDSLRANPKYRRRQSIASEQLARLVESRTPSASDPLDQAPVVGGTERYHSGSSSSIASSLLSQCFSQGSSPAGSTSSETDPASVPATSYGYPDEESGVLCASPEELHPPPPPSAFLTSAWSSLTSLSALSFASSSSITANRQPSEAGEQHYAKAGRIRRGREALPPSPPSSPETDPASGIARTLPRLSSWSAIRSMHVRFRPCARSLDSNTNAGEADDADATVNAFILRIQDLALQQQQQQAATNATASSRLLHSPTGLSTMPSRWPRIETCVGSPPSIKVEYWSGKKKEIVPERQDLDQLLRLVLTSSHRT